VTTSTIPTAAKRKEIVRHGPSPLVAFICIVNKVFFSSIIKHQLLYIVAVCMLGYSISVGEWFDNREDSLAPQNGTNHAVDHRTRTERVPPRSFREIP
jgi:hypothetical protein